MAIKSLQNIAHATTALLSWHVQNFVAIPVIHIGLASTLIAVDFELLMKNVSVKW